MNILNHLRWAHIDETLPLVVHFNLPLHSLRPLPHTRHPVLVFSIFIMWVVQRRELLANLEYAEEARASDHEVAQRACCELLSGGGARRGW